MRDQASIVIVGAGIVGCSAAYHLALLGQRDIVVLDKGELFENDGSTSHAPGGMFLTNSSKMMLLILSLSASSGIDLCMPTLSNASG